MRRLAVALLGLALGAPACSDAPRPPDPRLWTVFDLQAASAGGVAVVAEDAGLPGGLPVGQVLAPGGTTLVLRDTLDVYEAAYVTTEVWAHYDRVWVEPMYVRVTDWNGGRPVLWEDGGGNVNPIFSVGPRSGFYSPFWQTIYVDVSAAPAPEALTSVRAVLDGGYPLRPGPGRTVSLVPEGITVGANGGAGIGSPNAGHGWLDGLPVSYLDFGADLFTWDEDGVVPQTPLYHFVFPGTGGDPFALDVPTVAGVGPERSGAVGPPTVDGQPRYASYWRLYTVRVPASAGVFAPPEVAEAVHPGLLAAIQNSGFPLVGRYSPDAAKDPDASSYIGHIAADPACFAAQPLDLEACHWLDSQAHIERYLAPTAVAETDIAVTCPLLSAEGKPITPGAW